MTHLAGTPGNDNDFAGCSRHGRNRKRSICKECNALYMRAYLRAQRLRDPRHDLLKRARDRARRAGLPFEISLIDIMVPRQCPALGVPITPGKKRSGLSPSLDRLEPSAGYVKGNVRVISDTANRLKGDRGLSELRKRAADRQSRYGAEYSLIADYVEREELLREVKRRARDSKTWAEIAALLDRRFAGEPAF